MDSRGKRKAVNTTMLLYDGIKVPGASTVAAAAKHVYARLPGTCFVSESVPGLPARYRYPAKQSPS